MGKEYYTAKDLAKLITFIENKKNHLVKEVLGNYLVVTQQKIKIN